MFPSLFSPMDEDEELDDEEQEGEGTVQRDGEGSQTPQVFGWLMLLKRAYTLSGIPFNLLWELPCTEVLMYAATQTYLDEKEREEIRKIRMKNR